MVLMGMQLPLEAVRRQIASGIDLMIHLGRLPDKSRRVLEIAEVTGYEDGEVRIRTLYEWDRRKETLQCVNELLHREKLDCLMG